MLQTATPITSLPDATIVIKELQAGGVDAFGGLRPLTPRLLAALLHLTIHLPVPRHLHGSNVPPTHTRPDAT